MLNLKELTMRNFLSVGNVTQTVNLLNPGITVIMGENRDVGGSSSRNGVGKAQPLSAKILTPRGWTTMGEIAVGDIVTTPAGGITTVTGVFPQGVIPTYEITTVDGRKTLASGEHLWRVYMGGEWTVATTQQIIGQDASLPLISPSEGYAVAGSPGVDIIETLPSEEDARFVQERFWAIGARCDRDGVVITASFPDRIGIASITRVEDQFCQCIAVADENHLYVTDDYIVTHNTTMAQALSFVLFGTALTNIKKDNLINKTNQKGMIVSLTFERDGKKYRIERGRKPNLLKWYVDEQSITSPDKDEAQGESKWTQMEIERVLGFNHEIFQNIVVLSTEIIPFLKLPAAAQRSIIENLLGITTLSEKAEVLKGLIRETKDSITREEIRIKSVTDSNVKIQQTIDDLEKKSQKWLDDHMENIQNIEEQLRELLGLDIDEEIAQHDRLAKLKTLTATLKQLATSEKSLEKQLQTNIQLLEGMVGDVEAVRSRSCPTCGSTLHDNHQTIMESLVGREREMNGQILRLGEELEGILSQKVALEGEIASLGNPKPHYRSLDSAYQHRATVERLEASLERERGTGNPFLEQISTLKREGIQEVDYTAVNDLVKLRDHQEFLLKLLTNKDSFIRKKIIDQNLQYLNHRLSSHLEKFSFPHSVRFLNDLTVDISLMGRDMDYDNLSSGERKRVILALNFAFRDVWESLNENLNLLFLDEQVDSGLDQTAIEAAWNLMNTYSRDRGKSVYLISHREELVNKATNILKVVKEGGFTTIQTME